MDIIEKIEKFLVKEEGIVAGDVATNTAQGSVDIINKDQCPDGFIWDEKKKICVKKGE
jgi:hypothetical protein